jgi:hypothetical protein
VPDIFTSITGEPDVYFTPALAGIIKNAAQTSKIIIYAEYFMIAILYSELLRIKITGFLKG